ncbi:hypothetical protein MNO14_07530 [Luteimonas sp. S4-F44]|uniref:hypothetical protein n=1 Tax=Luteimonas sp. S4-F44 TaxID=2925842 RepID=UPI001F52F18E|nr:hypothetical protein [Luteimonas sp. S4-F44]UNK43889.1 hypothetical protein MNO14_07530 [Luteimonas sp. S4-F44]
MRKIKKSACVGVMLALLSAAAVAASVISIHAMGVAGTEQGAVRNALGNGEIQCLANYRGVVTDYQIVSVEQQASGPWVAIVEVFCKVT